MDERTRGSMRVGWAVLALATACSGDNTSGTNAADASGAEAASMMDGGNDSLPGLDSGTPDSTFDAGTTDTGAANTTTLDAAPEAGATDTGADTTGTDDTGTAEADTLDAGSAETGATDDAATDAVDSGSDVAAGHLVYYTFDTDTQGWDLNNYTDVTATNLDAPDSGVSPSATFVPNDGNPDFGSLQVVAPFTGYNQYIEVQSGMFAASDLSGRTLHANVKLVSGAFPSGYVALYAYANPNYHYGSQGAVDASLFAIGTWVPVSFDVGIPAGFDPTMIFQVGVQIGTPPPSADGGSYPVDAGSAPVFEIDTVTD